MATIQRRSKNRKAMTMTEAYMVRQGDVLVVRVDELPAELEETKSRVVARGETTNHNHRLFGRGCKLYRFRDTQGDARFITVDGGGAEMRVVGGESVGLDGAKVPRHLPVKLPSGKYEIRIQKSWSAEMERAHTVRD